MQWKPVRNKAATFVAGGLTALMFAAPRPAHAGLLDIFGAINSLIGGKIGGTLTSMNTIASAVQSDMQLVLFPVKLINQTQNYVTTIIGSYRGWMSTVFTMQTGSAQLSGTQLLELESLSGLQGPIGNVQGKVSNINTMLTKLNGAIPSALAAPLAHRQVMDMDDALSKDVLSQSVMGDQSSANLVSMANMLETQSASAAPGTAPMLAASAKAAELSSMAAQHKLYAAMLRSEAGSLAHEMAAVKQSVAQTQQLNQNLTVASPTQ